VGVQISRISRFDLRIITKSPVDGRTGWIPDTDRLSED
jgi:hypothetical protein